jgi:integrator complex subunit 2
VQSILVVNNKNTQTYINEPIAERELSLIFDHKIYSIELNQIDSMEIGSSENDTRPTCLLTTQLLLLYYLLWYEETRLNQSKNVLNVDRSAKQYSSELLDKIPVYYLLQEARREQNKYGLFFPSLLRLVSTHYPHFCLVADWLYTVNHKRSEISRPSICQLRKLKDSVQLCFERCQTQPTALMRSFEHLLNLPDNCVWPFAELFINNLHRLLLFNTPRALLDRAKQVWLRLNNVFPDEFQVLTVNAIASNKFTFKPLTWKDIVADPLQVLRCDRRVFECPQFIEILLQMLQAFLVASRTFYVHHLIETPSKLADEEKERDELRFALLQSQESAAIQILLEACRPSAEPEKDETLAEQRLAEVQRLICVHLHQVFIADPNLAKLVHFQGYDSSLLSLVVSKVPSMHICLDFIPELLSQPDLNKQVTWTSSLIVS